MQADLIPNLTGNYRFRAAENRPFSSGVVTDDGFDLAHVTFAQPLPLEQGIRSAAHYVATAGRPAESIAGFELRIPKPLARADFETFNHRYAGLLRGIGLEVNGVIPAGRTNVAPTIGHISEPSVRAFSFAIRSARSKPGFLLSGVPEQVQGTAGEMLRNITAILAARAREVGCSLADATNIQLYRAGALEPSDFDALESAFGEAIIHGLTWYPSLPPVEGLKFEIDARSAGSETFVFV